MVKISIIIPHYNSVNSLIKLVNTIPKMDDVEIIIVDDKSSDQLDELRLFIEKCKHKNLLFLTNNTNKKGAGVSRNLGMYKARGEWLLFADADDFFTEGFYERIKRFFSSNFDVVFFTPTSIENDTGNLSNRHVNYEKINEDFLKKGNKASEVYLRYRFNVPWSKLIRTDFIKRNKISFDEVIASNDIMFSAKVGYYMENFYVSREVIYCVTRSKGTLTTNTNETIYNARLGVYINYCNFLREKLKKSDIKLLNINGLPILLRTIQYRFSLKKTLEVYSELRRNRINIVDSRLINPLFTIKKLYQSIKNYGLNKRFFTK